MVWSKKKKNILAVLVVLTSSFFIYASTSEGKTPHNYSVRLANALLHGKYYVEEAPPWLSELIPVSENKYYTVYPPMPALLLIPFVAVYSDFPQQYLSHFLGVGIAAISSLLALKTTKKRRISIYMFFAIGFGSIVWFMSSVGSVWYLGQITACFFLLLSVYESQTKKRLILMGTLMGAAYLSRVHLLAISPILFLLSGKKVTIKNAVLYGLGILPFFLFNSYYNLIRFSSIFDKGYFLIPGVTEEPWFSKGIVHPSYLLLNLKTMFLSLPIFTNEFPYIKPSWYGLSILITSPFFIFSIFTKLTKTDRLCILASVITFLIVGSHGSNGFAQFGYRFALDFYPFLILLTINGLNNVKNYRLANTLLALSIIVNAWGVLWINKFHWVGF